MPTVTPYEYSPYGLNMTPEEAQAGLSGQGQSISAPQPAPVALDQSSVLPQKTFVEPSWLREEFTPAAPAPVASAPKPRPAMRGPAPVQVPEQFGPQYGGYYPPRPEYESNLAAAVANQTITPQQAQAALQKYAAWEKSPTGFAIGAAGQQAQTKLGVEYLNADNADILAGVAEKTAEVQRQGEAKVEALNEQWKANTQQFLKAQEDNIAQINQLNAEVAAEKIDPDQYWAKQSNWGKVLSAIAVGLGGFGAGMRGGPNMALDIINRAIDRDIEAQKANLANKRATLAEKRSVYAMAREKFQDEQAAVGMTRSMLLDQVARTGQRMEAEGKTQQLRNQGAMIRATAQQAAQDSRNAVILNLMDQQRRQQEAAAQWRAGAAERERKARIAELELRGKELDVAKKEMEVAGGEEVPEGVVAPLTSDVNKRIIRAGNQSYLVPVGMDVGKAAEAFNTTQNAANTVNKVLEFSGLDTAGNQSNAAAANSNARDAAMAQLKAQLGKIYGSDKMAEEMVTDDPAALVALRKQLNEAQDTFASTFNLRPVEVGERQVKRGNEVVRIPVYAVGATPTAADAPRPATVIAKPKEQ